MNEFLDQIRTEALTVAQAGEDGILKLIEQTFPEHLLRPKGVTVPTFVDDCAVIGRSLLENDKELVITSDVLVEGADFLFDWMSYFDIGYKSLMVNLSDIASMGAEPFGMIVVVGLSEKTPMLQIESFLDGLKMAAEKHSVILLGGDLSESQKFFCNITVLGKIEAGRSLKRAGVKKDDIVCVSGFPGEARAGLFIALGKVANIRASEKSFLNTFFRPEARIDIGRILMQSDLVRGSIDLSDGISRDISRIAQLNNIRIEVNAKSLPATHLLMDFWESRGYDYQREIAVGGEDFEIMFCCPEDCVDTLKNEITNQTGVPINIIGSVMDGEGAFFVNPDGSKVAMKTWGFDHFDSAGGTDS